MTAQASGDSGFGEHSTTDEVLAGKKLDGQLFVVTGASAGLGIETCRALAAAGAEVVMAARDPGKTEAAMASIRESVPGARLEFLALDLADLDSIRRATDTLQSRHPVIHRLINNAGVMACPLQRTREGCEMQFGTNHIGHFLWTCRLVPALRAGAPARVVNLSSAGHRYSAIRFDDPHFEHEPYDKWLAYGQSKTANILFSLALDRRLAPTVTTNAVHPGAILTELGRHITEEDVKMLTSGGTGRGGFTFKSVPAGAATSVWAATSADLEGRGGLYLEDCNIAAVEAAGAAGAEKGYRAYARDEEAAERLWQLSEQIVGETFRF